MDQKQRDHLEERLVRERQRALRALARFDEDTRVGERDSDGDLTLFPLHMADGGTETDQREKTFLLASKEGRRVYWIDEALQTLYKQPQDYGRCQECDDAIPFERLDIVPWARLCVSCQQGEEDGRARAA